MSENTVSIKSELEALRPFADKVISGSFPLYSESEIREAENRLGISLPTPVRELYLRMADLLIGHLCLTPLELLHWEQDYLGFYEFFDDGLAFGIRKGDDPNCLYRWESIDPEEESYDYRDEFTELCEEDDWDGRRELAQKCHDYWQKINARYAGVPAHVQRLDYKARYNCLTDAYGLFLVLHAIDQEFQDFQREHPDGSFLLRAEDLASGEKIGEENGCRPIPDSYFIRLHRQITQKFTPLSPHPQLLALETPGLQMAYLHRDPDALLLAFDWDPALTLLTTDTPGADFIRELQTLTGLTFKRCNL